MNTKNADTFCIAILFSFLLSNCTSADIIATETLSEWGYEKSPNSQYLSTFCLIANKPLNAVYLNIREKKGEAGEKVAVYRFTLAKEIYPTAELAKKMLLAINTPGKRGSKYSKMCAMRKGFVVNHTLYFVHTDVGGFKLKLDDMLKKFRSYIHKQHAMSMQKKGEKPLVK